MPTEKADIFALAKFGDLNTFKSKFDINKIDCVDSNGSGLLHHAIAGQQFEIALFLIEKGINLNIINSEGQSALHLICTYQNIEVAKRLLQNGIEIELRDKYGNSAIWTATFNCKGQKYELVELLMQYRPDVVTKNKAGRSPIDFATQVGNTKLISILKQA